MDAYLTALIWLLSAIFCKAIAMRRSIKTTAWRASLVTVLGPFAIPLILAIAPSPVTASVAATPKK